MKRFEIATTPLSGVMRIQRTLLQDPRGFFTRLFCAQALRAAGWEKPIAQINHSCSDQAGTIRGMHLQHPPHAEMKLVSCLRGEIFDVAVDVRRGSPTFLQWYGTTLSATNHQALLIPEGFAHGFQTLTDDVEVIYCTSAAYTAEAEDGLNPLDPRLAIDWPHTLTKRSARDAAHTDITDNYEGVTLR